MNNPVLASVTYCHLGVAHRMLGNLAEAESFLLKSAKIDHELDRPEIWKVFLYLADVARDRGDADAAARWQSHSDGKRNELLVLSALRSHGQACLEARRSRTPAPAKTLEVLARMRADIPPWPAVAAFLEAIASGGPLPPVPAGLSQAQAKFLQEVREAAQA